MAVPVLLATSSCVGRSGCHLTEIVAIQLFYHCHSMAQSKKRSPPDCSLAHLPAVLIVLLRGLEVRVGVGALGEAVAVEAHGLALPLLLAPTPRLVGRGRGCEGMRAF